MHAFVTGATGFLGRNVVEQLILQGWQVTALYRTPCKQFSSDTLQLHWQQGDITDIDSLRAAMPPSVDAVFHLACDTQAWRLDRRQQYQTNVTGTENLCKVALEKRAIRFIHTSSIAVYGFHNGAVDENSEMRGMDCPVRYFRSKFLAEEVVREYIEKGLDAVILNPTAVIGPYDNRSWVKLFDCIKEDQLPGIPPGRKSFCYAPEVALAHIQAFILGRSGENYILSGPTTDFTEVFQILSAYMQHSHPMYKLPSWLVKLRGLACTLRALITQKEPDISLQNAYVLCANVTAESEKAKRELQYKNHTSLNEMLGTSYEWWLSQQTNKQKSPQQHLA
ncbi:SDR family oxidoreductase [Oceaniserpentilla sp. 4NH20-0058]|uniref:NAD-dependent epimerase/dehydratase family protein n=1 Tax=Oceaniserpentilla sp. 4NH20-0058 TaxID=3127660 RepID=UPI00310B39B2